jgi:hypothetical protein
MILRSPMRAHRTSHSTSTSDLLCKMLFPGESGARRRTNLRFLVLSLLLALVVCGGMGMMLWLMH